MRSQRISDRIRANRVPIVILKKRYRVSFERLSPNLQGECDDPTSTDKRIRIKRGLSDRETLETVIHEALHAADWQKDESWIEEVANDIARFLWRLGYRRARARSSCRKGWAICFVCNRSSRRTFRATVPPS